MRKIQAVVILAAIVVILSAWSTNRARGTVHDWATVSAAGAVIGTGVAISPGLTFLSISTFSTDAAKIDSIYVESDDIVGGSGNIYIGTNVQRSWNFPSGIDSLEVLELNTAGVAFIEVSN